MIEKIEVALKAISAVTETVTKVKTIVCYLASIVERHGKPVDEEAEPVKFSEDNSDYTFEALHKRAKASLEKKDETKLDSVFLED